MITIAGRSIYSCRKVSTIESISEGISKDDWDWLILTLGCFSYRESRFLVPDDN